MSRRTGYTLVRVVSVGPHPAHATFEAIVVGKSEPAETEFSVFDMVFFSDFHSCTPSGDSQQYTAARMADFVECDQPECGGTGGWLSWWSNDPDAGPDSPNNPLTPYK